MKRLESEIKEIDDDITKVLEETGACYREMTPLNNEIGEFLKTLHMFGLTFDDIKSEYFKIKSMLEIVKSASVSSEKEADSKPAVLKEKTETKKDKTQEESSQNQPN